MSGLLWVLAGVAFAGDSVTMVGEYVWKKGKPHDLRAVFTPDGNGAWTVDFHFKHYGKHTFSGTATGDLLDGELRGQVYNDKESRQFTFDGTVRDGAFAGEHAELLKKGPKPTGTLVLRREQPVD